MNSLKSFISLIAFIFVVAQSSYGMGGDVGNGGDAVLCQSTSTNPFSGYYSLDYLAQYQDSDEIAEVNSLEQSLNRIEGLLQKKLPELYESFKLFHRNLFNTTDASQIQLWEKAPFGLVDLKDEKLLSVLPSNCLNEGKLSVVQAAIRVNPIASGRPLGYYLYKYVPDIIEKLQATNSVQASFLFVHEWLWQHSSSVDRNRRVNYWLHSKKFENLSRDQSLSYLEGVGFTVPTLQPPFFSSESCKADESEYNRLINFAEKRLSSQFPYNLGNGRFLFRQRLCDADTSTCQKYDYYEADSLMARSFFDQSIYVTLEGIHLNISSRNSGGPAHVHFTCEIDFYKKKILECSEYVLSSGYPYSPSLKFELTIGSGCFRFTNKSVQRQFDSVFTEQDKVVFVTTTVF